MFDRRILKSHLSELGCREVARHIYLAPPTLEGVEWTLRFRLLGIYRWDLEAFLSYKHTAAAEFGDMCIRTVPGWAAILNRSIAASGDRPRPMGSIGFDRLAPGWAVGQRLSIRELTAVQTAQRVAADVREHVLPFAHSIASLEVFYERLAADEEPMTWSFSMPLCRAAEVAYLARQLGVRRESVSSILRERRGYMVNQMCGEDVNVYLERVVRLAYDAAV
jgi:hypothetical protein